MFLAQVIGLGSCLLLQVLAPVSWPILVNQVIGLGYSPGFLAWVLASWSIFLAHVIGQVKYSGSSVSSPQATFFSFEGAF